MKHRLLYPRRKSRLAQRKTKTTNFRISKPNPLKTSSCNLIFIEVTDELCKHFGISFLQNIFFVLVFTDTS